MECKKRKMSYYIERRLRLDNNCSYTETEESLISSKKKLIILTDERAMGKTTILNRIYNKIIERDPSCQIKIIELSKYQLEINLIEKEILNQEIVMFDGFDELWLDNRTFLINLIKNLKINQIWLTACSSMKGILKMEFSEISYRMEPFTEENQIEFIKNFAKKPDLVPFQLEAIRNDHGIDLGLPFNTQMVSHYLAAHKDLPTDLSITDFYETFLRNYCKDEFDEIHQHLGVLIICPEAICRDNFTPEEMSMINRTGIASITKAYDGSQIIKFNHKNAAIYYVAKYFLNLIDKCENDFLIDFLITEVLGSSRFLDVRSFINDLLKPEVLSKKIYQKLSERLFKILDDNREEFNLQWIFDVNVLKMLYEVIQFFTPEDQKRFKNNLPEIDVYFSCTKEFLFLERILDENSRSMNYELKNDKLLVFVLDLESIEVVKKYFKYLEEQIGFEDLKKFIMQNIGFMKPTLLFITNENCLEFLLDYLKEKILSIEEFKSLLLVKNSNEELFVNYTKLTKSLSWIKSNMEDGFYKRFLEICYPKMEKSIKDEEDFLFVYKELKNCSVFDKNQFLCSAIRWRFNKAVDVLLAEEEFVDDSMLEFIEFTSAHGNSESLVKLIKICTDKKVQLNFPLDSILTFDELESLLCGDSYKVKEETKSHIKTIGTTGLLLRVVADKFTKIDQHFDEMEHVEEQVLSELLTISKLPIEFCSNSFDTKALIKLITERKGEKYLLEILNILLTPELSKSFVKNPAIVDFCLELLKN